MKESKKQKEFRLISIEEQQNEAKHDATGKIRRYLELAEKLFNANPGPTAEAA